MQKEIIAIDADGVLFDFTSPILKLTEEKFNVNIPKGTPTEYEFDRCPILFDLIKQENWFRDMYLEFIDRGMFGDLKPLPHAQQAVNYLKQKGYELFIITNRSKNRGNLAKETKETVEKYFPDSFSDIIFKPKELSKAQICTYLNSKVLIEDCLENIMGLSQTIPVLINHTYNQTQESIQNQRNGNNPILLESTGIYRIRNLSYLRYTEIFKESTLPSVSLP